VASLDRNEYLGDNITRSGGVPDSTGWMRQRLHAEDDPLASLIIGSKNYKCQRRIGPRGIIDRDVCQLTPARLNRR